MLLTIDKFDQVTRLSLNRPKSKNALNRALVLELAEALESVAQDKKTRAVILTGNGGSFCAGADLKSAMADADVTMAERIDEFHRLIRAIIRAEKPFVAAIDGPAVGFGADLALACDLRVMSDQGYVQEKFVKIGLMPDGGGTFLLPRLVGMGRALEYLLLGSKIDASLALKLGLTNRVTRQADLEAESLELARRLAEGPPIAMAKIRHAVRQLDSIDAALAREKAGQLELLNSQDVAEGVLAWAERRQPQFRGC